MILYLTNHILSYNVINEHNINHSELFDQNLEHTILLYRDNLNFIYGLQEEQTAIFVM